MHTTTQPRHRARLALLLTFAMLFTVLVALPGSAAHGLSGIFESADGNLEASDTDHVDWNSFTAPAVAADWNFARFQDNVGNPDDIFSGGVKQDDDCAGTRQGSMGGGNSKFDLSDIYLANKNIDGDEYLFLAWVRVPSSPSASSHIAYEFNKGTLGNCPGSDLLRRVAGDMLVVYDFEGGDADSNVKLARWLTAAADSAAQCEAAKSLPCWGNVIELVDSGFADAKVNRPSDVGNVVDAHRGETLVPVQFGEAGINLTEAGVFDADSCEEFGHVLGVSRSSGNSGTAQMKDKVGPHSFEIGNCGSAVVHKVDDTTDALVAGATFTIAPVSDPTDTTPMTEVADGIFCAAELFSGDYVVTETSPPPDYDLDPTNTRTVTVTADGTTCADAAQRTADATFENARHTGSIVVHKLDEDGELLADAGFTITPGDISMTEVSTGIFCADGLDFGTYTVTETTVPDGYTGAAPATGIEVSTKSDCSDAETRTGATTFTNRLAPGRVNVDKTDDAGNPLDGATFTLTDKDDGSVVFTCTTGVSNSDGTDAASGACSFIDVPPGEYVLDETVVPDGHEKAAGLPQDVTVGIGAAPGEGQTVNVGPLENPRLHKVLVIVCHEGTDTLAESKVADEDGTVTFTPPEGHALEGLCDDDDAEDFFFTGKSHDDEDYTVGHGSEAHPVPAP